jgi:hypothetical protein
MKGVCDTRNGKDNFFETYNENAFLFRENEIHENEFDIEDIAHALSLCCRYNGHVTKFYSVAEHCCLLYDFVLNHYGTKAYSAWGGWTYKKSLQMLMHDSSEAYISDMPAPMKQLLPDFNHMEDYVERAIFKYFDIPMPDAFVKELDIRILIDERQQAMPGTGKFKWFYEDLGTVPLGVKLHFWEPEQSKEEFLNRWNYIKPLYDSVKDDLHAQEIT